MSISVKIHQEIDGEVMIDSFVNYSSKKEFNKALNEAIENWKVMQGKYAVIKNDIVDRTLKMTVADSECDDFETWVIC